LPDRRRHRGRHPEDDRLFSPPWHGALREACADLSWLLGRGYALPSALKVVGDRYRQEDRQRLAVMRSACGEEARLGRLARRVGAKDLGGVELVVDGYNVLITLESALSCGVLLRGRDGCVRDLASLGGHFKRVEETEPSAVLLGEALEDWGVADVRILLDAPVSNSGRLAALLREVARRHGWPWAVEVVPSADRVLRGERGVVATADSAVLDACGAWFDLGREVLASRLSTATWIDLGEGAGARPEPDRPA